MSTPYWLIGGIFTIAALLCATICTVAVCVAYVADMIRVTNLADARRPAEDVWRTGLSEHVKTLPRDRGKFTKTRTAP